jgi:SAM-dependent methyltransferase
MTMLRCAGAGRTLTLTLDFDDPNGPWRQVEERDSGQHRSPARPIVCRGCFGAALAHPAWLPFRDGAFDSVRLIDQLEYVRREEELLAEIGRALAPGGTLTLRVPAVGPLAGFDALNLTRYVVDIARRGRRPVETWEIGWRKHYSEADIRGMLAKAGLEVASIERARFIVSELLDFCARLIFRVLADDEPTERRFQRRLNRVRRAEDRLAFGAGLLMTVVARKAAAD